MLAQTDPRYAQALALHRRAQVAKWQGGAGKASIAQAVIDTRRAQVQTTLTRFGAPFTLSPRAQYLVDYLDLPAASGVDGATWEYFQLAHLSDNGMFRIETKSRQIAWSFTIACEAVANAILKGTSSLFQSINLDEAREKILYARAIYENLQAPNLPKLTQPDTTTAIGFDNGARIISSPGTPQRGKARFWIYLDEWAHQKHDRANYTAALPIISKGGAFRGASSPMGAGGMFWEVVTESMQRYPGFTRVTTPWWEVHAFCRDVTTALVEAPTMSTRARVDAFGSPSLVALYQNMPEEDFQQEYECAFADESTSWITWEEIGAVASETLYCETAVGVEASMAAIARLAQAIQEQRVELVFGGGTDIGRTRNTTEIGLVGKSTVDSYPLRLMLTLDNTEFDAQFAVLCAVMDKLPILKMLIDRNGLGMQLAENAAKKYPGKCEGVDFTNATKQLWATDGKMLIQQKKTPLPVHRDLHYQIHSIKKLVTPAKNVTFDTERNEKHHADKFWMWVLALAGVNIEPVSTWEDMAGHGSLDEDFDFPFG